MCIRDSVKVAKQVNINLHLVINFINISLHINNFIFFLHNGFRNLMNVKVVAYLWNQTLKHHMGK